MSTSYHEPQSDLSVEARDFHRALQSLLEEIEAVDWYHQRWDTSKDETLREVLAHNRDEEIEHACMMLEWLRRRMPVWDRMLTLHLHKEGPVADAEDAGAHGRGGAATDLRIGGRRRTP